ncbi:MAG TPA: prolyl oligopeptidase family serine peptidase [Rhizobacter sp.]|nr:prolyl oligopeptidase family serine peptidase [Rhizobacter sp.]
MRLLQHPVRAALVLSACLSSVPGFAADGPPVAPVRPITDTYFGTEVVDPYRYLENLKDPEVQAWMKAQAAYARGVLDRIPGRDALLDRIHALSNVDTRRRGFVQRGQRYFYEVTEPGAEQPKLYYRDGLSGAEHLLLDPATLGQGTDTHYAVDYFTPSWDGKLLAYGLSTGGSEASVLRVLDVATGKNLPEAIERAHGSTVTWRADNRSFFYFKFNKVGPNTPPNETEFNARTYLHQLGRGPDGEADALVFGRGVSNKLDVPEGQITYVIGSPQSKWAVAVANHNADDNPSTYYVAPLAQVNGPATPWKKIADVDDGVSAAVVRGDTLYFLSRKEASRFRILALSLARPDIRKPQVIVPEGPGVITDFGIAADGLYYRVRDGGFAKLMKTGFDGQGARAVPLPFEGNLFGPVTDPSQPGALFNMQSPSRPPQVFTYDPASDKTADSGLVPPSKVDASMLESKEVMVTSYDGTRVPLTLVYKKGLVLDGSHPTILDGYGAYGIVAESFFWAPAIAWVERGGVIATAHVRGGGEFGEDWHQGGMKRTKLNTVLDFIACGQYLVDQKYTTPKRLVAEGGSAGGITVGRAMTLRPELFGVVLDHVGMSDTLRSETEPNGPPNVVEFGSVKTKDGFHGLYGMSPYLHVAAGTPYPAVMFLTGANDPRVAPWHMMKMAAKTQAATSSKNPVLLRIDYDAGHGLGSNRSQREMQLADTWAFALWQMGEPAFQPK